MVQESVACLYIETASGKCSGLYHALNYSIWYKFCLTTLRTLLPEMQGNAELTSLRRARELLIVQRENDAAEHRAMLLRLQAHSQRQKSSDFGGESDSVGATFSSTSFVNRSDDEDTDTQMLAKLLFRVKHRDTRHRDMSVPASSSRGESQSAGRASISFDADISARVRLFAAEDRLVFELTKRADLLRSLEEALRRRRATEVEASASAQTCEEDSNAVTDAHPPATEAVARLRVVDEEVETLDMRLGIVERRVGLTQCPSASFFHDSLAPTAFAGTRGRC